MHAVWTRHTDSYDRMYMMVCHDDMMLLIDYLWFRKGKGVNNTKKEHSTHLCVWLCCEAFHSRSRLMSFVAVLPIFQSSSRRRPATTRSWLATRNLCQCLVLCSFWLCWASSVPRVLRIRAVHLPLSLPHDGQRRLHAEVVVVEVAVMTVVVVVVDDVVVVVGVVLAVVFSDLSFRISVGFL